MKATQAAFAAYRRLKSLAPDAVVPRVTRGEAGIKGDLRLTDVTFYHPGRKTPALRSVSLALTAGQSLGIVGPNGSGKSTLAGHHGRRLGSNDGRRRSRRHSCFEMAARRRHSAHRLHARRARLIEGSVHDNIARFADSSLISVARAAMRAGVHETMQSLALSLRYACWSAGQRAGTSRAARRGPCPGDARRAEDRRPRRAGNRARRR